MEYIIDTIKIFHYNRISFHNIDYSIEVLAVIRSVNDLSCFLT